MARVIPRPTGNAADARTRGSAAHAILVVGSAICALIFWATWPAVAVVVVAEAVTVEGVRRLSGDG